MKNVLALALLLGFALNVCGDEVDDTPIFKAVSSTTLEEKELLLLLEELRQKIGPENLDLLSFSSISENVKAALANYLRGWSLQHWNKYGAALRLDRSLDSQYKKEAFQLETALKANPSGVNAKNSEGLTPLHLAILNNKPNEIIVPLLASGADIYAADKKGLTPEHYAAQQCALDTEFRIQLPPGESEYTWGIFEDARSCWTQRTLAAERRQMQGGIRSLYDWLERGRHYLPNPETLSDILGPY